MVVQQTLDRKGVDYSVKTVGLGKGFKNYPQVLVLYSVKSDHSLWSVLTIKNNVCRIFSKELDIDVYTDIMLVSFSFLSLHCFE